MPQPPDETSRPARRRALGRGPGTAGPVPMGEPEASQPLPVEADALAAGPRSADGPAGEPEPRPSAADGPQGVGDGASGVPAAEARADDRPPAHPEHPSAAEQAPAPPADAGQPTVPGGAEVVGPGGSVHGGGVSGPAPADAAPVVDDGRFTVRLANFEGPFDLLLQLISKHKLDVTEVALSKVTDEFMAHIRAMGPDWDLDQTTEFLVVAATLLDLKAARLLPAAEVEDEADLALLEARDLLFARLLQYRAYKQIAAIFEDRWESEGRRYPRTVGLEAHHAELLPEVVISIGAEGFAKLAVKAMQPKAKPQVYVDHIHAPLVSVREQAGIVVALLRERGSVGFRELTEDAGDTLTVVARFLALLELYREKAVALDQEDALGELTVTWTGGNQDAQVTDEFDHVVEEKG
ncbi:segregation/condensation protein A [Streptomyces sp. NPDC059875]|uniref:segregation and condensation protein A n=1 Tax=unclassified Streptomyces TaxID=2593676 RepID=UPI00364A16C9